MTLAARPRSLDRLQTAIHSALKPTSPGLPDSTSGFPPQRVVTGQAYLHPPPLLLLHTVVDAANSVTNMKPPKDSFGHHTTAPHAGDCIVSIGSSSNEVSMFQSPPGSAEASR